MNAIKLKFSQISESLTGSSKWWGAPDMPADFPYPVVSCASDGDCWDEPLTFLCQVRCEDVAPFDKQNLLPHEGMLYFFAAIDYFLGMDCPLDTPIGPWNSNCVRVMYSPSCNGLTPYEMHYENGDSVFLPAVGMTFESCPEREDGFKLLGRPYLDEINEQYDDYVSLLQIDENDNWGLRFYDCGMLCLLIRRDDLEARKWGSVQGYLHSF